MLNRVHLTACLVGIVATAAQAAAPPVRKASVSDLMSLTRLAPAKPIPDQCLLHYRITTNSPKCQELFDQGLGYYYSYVWMEAARSFETALRYDPTCPMAWWGLSRSLERWGKGTHTKALLEAWKLKDHASARERMLLKSRMQEKGQLPGVGDGEQRVKAAVATLDELLSLHDDDEEAWYGRAQLSGGAGLFGGQASAVPFYKALLRVNPLHPGANHELVHFYENVQRPALGWKYAENYIASSPGIPHPFHMQAHLATRLGRWGKTSDRSTRAIELQRAYHRRENVKANQDGQFTHHLQILLVSLTHDGRFREAHAILDECRKIGQEERLPAFRLSLNERDYDGALKLAGEVGRGGKVPAKGPKRPRRRGQPDKSAASYLAALVHIHRGEPGRALPEIEVLQQACRERKNDRKLELQLWEAQGLYLCATGSGTAGLKLLQKAVDKTKNDYSHHAWGNGAYYMEAWGVGALRSNKLDVAEEAFHEALAHDPGSVKAALGMQVVCERQARSEEVIRYAALAHRCWSRADTGHLETELAALRGQKVTRPDPTRPRQN